MSSAAFWAGLPHAVTQSRIYREDGVLTMPLLPGAEAVEELTAEAVSVWPEGIRNELAAGPVMEERGGNPSRAYTAANAGHVQWRIFSAPALVASLMQICGLEMEPTGGGTYSYYERSGDFLALHRDILTCDLTLITCLRDTGVAPAGGVLFAYPQYRDQPLARAREAGRAAATPVTIRPGESAAILGGVIPHEVSPMQPGQERIVSVMCYRVAGVGLPHLSA